MSAEHIITLLIAERDKLNRAIEVLQEMPVRSYKLATPARSLARLRANFLSREKESRYEETISD